MPRTKTGNARHLAHKKVFDLAKGFRMARHRLFKTAHEAVIHAGAYSFNGRKERKQSFRRLWIIRINAALKLQENPIPYSQFIKVLDEKNIKMNRKVLSELAAKLPTSFSQFFQFTQK
jgi:large subunit ribosomal protein L20